MSARALGFSRGCSRGRAQLAWALESYPGARVVDGTTETTTLPGGSVDVITCAQALNWFDIGAFRAECMRIGGGSPLVVALYNYKRGEARGSRYDMSTAVLYRVPAVREFDSPVYFNRESWHLYHASMAGVPQPSDSGYAAYAAGLDAEFDRGSADDVLRLDLVTRVYSERLG